jgi:hypothetical protein
LARNYESNGPDVKIRGTATHIAEKYMSLARDALASGDMVTAESYLQHAEHYNRIIMAAQSQLGPQAHGGQQPQGEGPNGGGGYRPRWSPDGEDDGDFEGEGPAGGEVRETRGSQDHERHVGDREHHGGGHERGGQPRGGRDRGQQRHAGNGSDATREANGAEPDAPQGADESAPDTVS